MFLYLVPLLIVLPGYEFTSTTTNDEWPPKVLLKEALVTFSSLVSAINDDEDLCIKFFHNAIHEMVDGQKTPNDAFDSIFNMDLTHTTVKEDKCKTALTVFNDKWEKFTEQDTKYLAFWQAIQAYLQVAGEEFNNRDPCLSAMESTATRIVNNGETGPEHIVTNQTISDLSKGLLKAALTFLDSTEANNMQPCVQTIQIIFNSYNDKIVQYLFQDHLPGKILQNFLSTKRTTKSKISDEL